MTISTTSATDRAIETGNAMNYTTERGETYRIEKARGNLSGDVLGFYAYDKNGNTVHPPVGAWEPVKPFATLDDAKAYLDSIHKED